MNASGAQINYLRWLSAAHPDVYAGAIRSAQSRQQLGELGFINFVVQAVAAAGSYVMKKKQEKKAAKMVKKAAQAEAIQMKLDEKNAQLQLLALNQQRAAQGLSPVNMQGQVIPSASLPTPSALTQFVKGATSNYFPLLIVGGVIVAVIASRRK